MILEKIKKIVNESPNKVVYQVDNCAITYVDLWNRASIYADKLKRQGNRPVIIYGNKSINTFLSIISCLIAQRAYVPISLKTPVNRIEDIIKLSKASLILTDTNNKLNNIEICNLDGLNKYQDNDIFNNNNDIAYIIFTSGTTGVPKGVPISYSNLDNFVKWISSLEPLCFYKNINVLNQANFSFDLSVADIYYSICNGHTLIALNNDIMDNYEKVFATIKYVNLIVATPTFIKMCLVNKEFNSNNYECLKCIYFCGESLDKNVVKELFNRFNDIKIINAYGPTEATSAVCAININCNMLDYDLLPVGNITNSATNITVENDEIILKGKSVFSGYLNDIKGGYYKEDNINCYKTGDIGYIDNNLLFCKGRLDSQIKYKGYRIELNDIESNIKKISGVNDSVVIPLYNNNVVKSIKAYVTVCDKINTIYIRKELEKLIPSYMIPKTISIIDTIPINENGKIDRKKLNEL